MPTIRQQLIELLLENDMNVREISQALHIREKEVYDHLDHISRSIANLGQQIHVTPFHCLACGYTFSDRKKFHRPGRCPRCKESRLESASYHIKRNQNRMRIHNPTAGGNYE